MGLRYVFTLSPDTASTTQSDSVHHKATRNVFGKG